MPGARQTQCQSINFRGAALEWGGDRRALVMGIINVTPDSFFDGGRYTEIEAALDHIGQMLEDGADIIDLGGASSRPAGTTYGSGAPVVPEEEEVARVVPVVEAVMRSLPDCLLSIDTYRSRVAREALAAGAHMINDITAFRADPEMPEVVAAARAPVVLMHSVGLPGQMPHAMDHDDVVSEVVDSLAQAVSTAESYGISEIIVDPGFGFGKTVTGNLRLVAELSAFSKLGKPIMVGVSRKSTIGAAIARSEKPRPVKDRLFGSLAVAAIAVANGASIVRTHDVGPTRDVVEAVHALSMSNAESPQAVS